MSQWVRDNGVFRADNPLSAGPLIELVRGNAEHFLLECCTDCSVLPSDGASQVQINGDGSWEAIFKRIRPFALPVRMNTDGTFGSLRFDMYGYGYDGDVKMRVYLCSCPPGPGVTNHSALWSASAGLRGMDFETYGEHAYTGAAGYITHTVTVQANERCCINTMPTNSVPSTNNADTMRTAMFTWVALDFLVENGVDYRPFVLRIRDVLT